MPTAFLLQQFDLDGYQPLRTAVAAAASKAGVDLLTADSVASGVREPIIDRIYRLLDESDLVIANISGDSQNVIYELGVAHGARRPVILIAHDVPRAPLYFDVRSVDLVLYDQDLADIATFEAELSRLIEAAIADPNRFTRRPTTRRDVNRLFVSYSHRDRAILERLKVHLKPLERSGVIDAWDDTRLVPGTDWKRDVEEALELARAAILLVSADFLASDFIVDNELQPLLRAAEHRGTVIIPVVVRPCRYTRDSSLSRLQAINDPSEPLAALDEVAQERLYDMIAEAVEVAMRPVH